MNLTFILFLIAILGWLIVLFIDSLKSYIFPRLKRHFFALNWIDFIILMITFLINITVYSILIMLDDPQIYDSTFEKSISYSPNFEQYDDYSCWNPYDWHCEQQAMQDSIEDFYISLADLYQNEVFMTMQKNIESFYWNRNFGHSNGQAIVFLNEELINKIRDGDLSNITQIASNLTTPSSLSSNFTDIVNQMKDGSDIKIYSPSFPQTDSEVMQANVEALDKYYTRILEVNTAVHEAIIAAFKQNYVSIKPVIITTVPVNEPQPLPSWTDVSTNHPDYIKRERILNRMVEAETYKVEDNTKWMEQENSYNLDLLFKEK